MSEQILFNGDESLQKCMKYNLQLDEQKALEYVANTREYVTTPEDFFPIRITGYFTGPLMINAMKNAGDFFYGAENRPVINHVKVIRDNYVVKMLDETTVDAIYKWV
jgi:hypothetical protein